LGSSSIANQTKCGFSFESSFGAASAQIVGKETKSFFFQNSSYVGQGLRVNVTLIIFWPPPFQINLVAYLGKQTKS
jgi:hypothetical protein